MARWIASANWAAGPALDGQRDTPLELSLSEGLGSTRHDVRMACICMRTIVQPAPRCGKSSRGIPRLRRSPSTLQGAVRLAACATDFRFWCELSPCIVLFNSMRTRSLTHSSSGIGRICAQAIRSMSLRLDLIAVIHRVALACNWEVADGLSRLCGLVASWLFHSRRQAHFLLAKPRWFLCA